MSINRVLITGNLTRDCELRTTPSGMSIASFGVAVNDRKRNQNGEWEDYANFVDCTMFGRRAEALAQYLLRGTKVSIEGKLHYSSWEDRNGGGRRSKLDVTVDELEFMSSRQQSHSNGANAAQPQPQGYRSGYAQSAPQRQARPQQAQPTQEPCATVYSDEDIPF